MLTHQSVHVYNAGTTSVNAATAITPPMPHCLSTCKAADQNCLLPTSQTRTTRGNHPSKAHHHQQQRRQHPHQPCSHQHHRPQLGTTRVPAWESRHLVERVRSCTRKMQHMTRHSKPSLLQMLLQLAQAVLLSARIAKSKSAPINSDFHAPQNCSIARTTRTPRYARHVGVHNTSCVLQACRGAQFFAPKDIHAFASHPPDQLQGLLQLQQL